MRSLQIHKRQIQRTVAAAAGQNWDFARPWAAQQISADMLAEVLSLPLEPDSVVDLNTSDGSLVFVPGISDPDSDDVIV